MRGGVAAGVAALALLVGCGSSADEPDGPRAEPDSSLPDSPFGDVLSWSAPSADVVWAVTTAEDTCASCAALWRLDQPGNGTWQRVHTFAEPEEPGRNDGLGPVPPVSTSSLVMAPDGEHGWFRWDTDGILATADGGESWTYLPSPLDAGETATGELAVHDGQLHLVTPGQVWRTPVGDADWSETTPEGASGIAALHTTPGGLWADDLGSGTVFTSHTGEEWERTPADRYGDLCLPAPGSPARQVATCETSDQGEPGGLVRVSTDRGRTWRTAHETDRYLERAVAGPGDQLVVDTDRDAYLVSGRERRELPRSLRGAVEWNVQFLGKQTMYVGSDRGIHVSRDGGRSWEDLTSHARTRGA